MHPNVRTNVPAAVFLKPLIDIKTQHAIQEADLKAARVHMNTMMVNIIKSNEALPSHLRPRQLFDLEAEMEALAEGYRLAKVVINNSIANLHQIARDAQSRIDPQYREDALRIVYEAEQAARNCVQTIDVILEEVDTTNAKLLTIH